MRLGIDRVAVDSAQANPIMSGRKPGLDTPGAAAARLGWSRALRGDVELGSDLRVPARYGQTSESSQALPPALIPPVTVPRPLFRNWLSR